MGDPADVVALRRAVLAVAVLDDVDVTPGDLGVTVPAAGRAGEVLVGWADVRDAVRAGAPGAPAVRARVAGLLRAAAHLSGAQPDDAWAQRHVRMLALPRDHVLHPGPAWVREQVLGGILDVGLGLVGLAAAAGADAAADTGPVVPLPPALAGRRSARWWPVAQAQGQRMGSLAAVRVTGSAPGVLRPVGGCDALTLLATRPLRAALAAGDGTGLRAVAAPTRARAWYDLRHVDPAFVGAVWSATDEPDRGVPRPLLVTRDEVVLGREPAHHDDH